MSESESEKSFNITEWEGKGMEYATGAGADSLAL